MCSLSFKIFFPLNFFCFLGPPFHPIPAQPAQPIPSHPSPAQSILAQSILAPGFMVSFPHCLSLSSFPSGVCPPPFFLPPQGLFLNGSFTHHICRKGSNEISMNGWISAFNLRFQICQTQRVCASKAIILALLLAVRSEGGHALPP